MASITAMAEPPSYYSGTNFAITAIMALILFILASLTTLSVSIDEKYLRIKFGCGIFRKKFAANEIASAIQVKIIGIAAGAYGCGFGRVCGFLMSPALMRLKFG